MAKWSSRLILSVFWIGIGGALFMSGMICFQLLPASQRERDYQRERIAAIQAQIDATRRSLEIKRTFLDQLNTDPAFLERVARERLHLVRPGETIIRLDESSETNSSEDVPYL